MPQVELKEHFSADVKMAAELLDVPGGQSALAGEDALAKADVGA